MLDLKQLKLKYVTDEKGDRSAVILPIEEFLELLEDIEDLAIIAEQRGEQTISHEELISELKRNGLLPD